MPGHPYANQRVEMKPKGVIMGEATSVDATLITAPPSTKNNKDGKRGFAPGCGGEGTHAIVRADHPVLQPSGVAPLLLAALPYNFLTVQRALADAGLDERSAFQRRSGSLPGGA